MHKLSAMQMSRRASWLAPKFVCLRRLTSFHVFVCAQQPVHFPPAGRRGGWWWGGHFCINKQYTVSQLPAAFIKSAAAQTRRGARVPFFPPPPPPSHGDGYFSLSTQYCRSIALNFVLGKKKNILFLRQCLIFIDFLKKIYLIKLQLIVIKLIF